MRKAKGRNNKEKRVARQRRENAQRRKAIQCKFFRIISNNSFKTGHGRCIHPSHTQNIFIPDCESCERFEMREEMPMGYSKLAAKLGGV